MPKGVVDVFKVIKVEKKDSHTGIVTLGLGSGLVDTVMEESAVRKLGQSVKIGHLLYLLLCFSAFSYVFEQGCNQAVIGRKYLHIVEIVLVRQGHFKRKGTAMFKDLEPFQKKIAEGVTKQCKAVAADNIVQIAVEHSRTTGVGIYHGEGGNGSIFIQIHPV